MKKILWLILFTYPLIGESQNISGKAVYKYIYNFPNASRDTSISTLYFNDKGESYYFSQDKRIFARSSDYRKENQATTSIRIDSAVVYSNTFTKEFYYTKPFMKNSLWVADTLKEIKWELLSTNERKKIGLFNCFSAKGKFAGRNYLVWYTPDIPVAAGPWKLYGLPGFIIEVEEETGYVFFTLDSLEIPCENKKDFGLEKIKSLAISKQEFVKRETELVEKIKGQSASMGVTLKITSTKGLELEDHQ